METPKVIEGVLAEPKDALTEIEANVGTEETTSILITAEEKLQVRQLENEFLKAQMETTRLQTIMQNLQKSFPAYIEMLKNKYKVDISKYNFDAVALQFTRK